MGAGDSKVDFGQLQIEHYRKPGLNDQEIYQLYQIFQGLGPNKEGMVKASKVKQQYQESMNKKDFDLQIGNLEHLNWDTFFHIMSNDIIEKNKDLEMSNLILLLMMLDVYFVLILQIRDNNENLQQQFIAQMASVAQTIC